MLPFNAKLLLKMILINLNKSLKIEKENVIKKYKASAGSSTNKRL